MASLWEDLTFWKDEEQERRNRKAQESLDRANAKIAKGVGFKYGPLARPQARRQFVRQNRSFRDTAPKQNALQQVKDIFDANSARDRAFRKSMGQPELYKVQQVSLGNKRPYDNLGQALVGSTARLANTVSAAVQESPANYRLLAALATGNQRALTNANRDIQQLRRRTLDPQSGVLRAGTMFDSPEEAENIGVGGAVRKGAGTGVGTFGEVVPVVRPIQFFRHGNRAARAVGRGTGGAIEAGAADIGEQVALTGRVDPRRLAVSTAFGAPLGVVSPQVRRLPDTGRQIVRDEAGVIGKNVLTPGQAKQVTRQAQPRANRRQLSLGLPPPGVSSELNVLNKLRPRTTPISLYPTIRQTRDVALRTTKADNRVPIGGRSSIYISKQAEKIPFKGRLVYGAPLRMPRRVTKDPASQRFLEEQIVDPQVKALANEGREVKQILGQLSDIFQQSGLTKRSLTGGYKSNKKTGETFFDFVDKGGSTSKESRRWLYQRVGKQQADLLIKAENELRKIYDDLLEQQNIARVTVGKDPIPRRKNYITHLQDEGFFSGLDIGETSATRGRFTRGTSKVNPFSKERRGGKYQKDPVAAADTYVRMAVAEKWSHEPVRRINNLHDALVERQKNQGDVPQAFLNWLKAQSDQLSGQLSKIDETFESSQIGRPIKKTIEYGTQKAGANLIGLNISSLFAQPAQLIQSASKLGIAKTGGATLREFGRKFGVGASKQEIAAESRYLTARHAHLDQIAPRLTTKLVQFSMRPIRAMQEGVDRIVRDAAVHRAKQLTPKERGGRSISEWADLATMEVTAPRGRGQLPHSYNTFVGRGIGQFGLEMGNALENIARDELRHGRIGGVTVFIIGTYGFNEGFEAISGRQDDIIINPVQAGIDTYKNVKEGRYLEAAGRIPGEIIANVPGGQALAGSIKGVDEDFGKRFFGESGAGRFGVGVPGVEVIKAVAEAATGQGSIGEGLKFAAPTAGGAIKRSATGISDFIKGERTGRGGQKLYDIERTPLNAFRAGLFGSYTTPEGRKYTKDLTTRIQLGDEARRGATADELRAIDQFIGTRRNQKTGQYETGKDVYDAIRKAAGLKGSPGAFNRLYNMFQKQKKAGLQIDPLWAEPKENIKKYLTYQAISDPFSDQKSEWYTENKKWYAPLAKKRNAFFKALPQNDPNKPQEPIEYPEATGELAKKKNKYFKLKGKEKFEYVRNNPDLQEQMDKEFKYKNDIAIARGLKARKAYPRATPQLQSFIDKYMASDKGQRKAIRNSNPNMYIKMSAYFGSTNLWKIANESPSTTFVGNPDTTQNQLEAAEGLARDIYQNPDGSYSIVPAGWMSGLSDGKFGGRRGGRGRGRRTSLGPKGTSARYSSPYSDIIADVGVLQRKVEKPKVKQTNLRSKVSKRRPRQYPVSRLKPLKVEKR